MKKVFVLLALLVACGCATSKGPVIDADWPVYDGQEVEEVADLEETAVVVEEKELTGLDLWLSRGSRVGAIMMYSIIIWSVL